MVRVTMTFPRIYFRDAGDYESIFSRIVAIETPTKIVKFTTAPHGIDVILDVEKDKVELIREAFKQEDVKVLIRGAVNLDKDLCIDCGQCISMCNVEALHFTVDWEVEFDPEKCVGCGLCIDCCPRFAISEQPLSTESD